MNAKAFAGRVWIVVFAVALVSFFLAAMLLGSGEQIVKMAIGGALALAAAAIGAWLLNSAFAPIYHFLGETMDMIEDLDLGGSRRAAGLSRLADLLEALRNLLSNQLKNREAIAEVGQLFEAAFANLGAKSKDILDASEMMAGLSGVVANSSEQVANHVSGVSMATEQMSGGIDTIAAAAEEMSTSVNTVATAVEEMTSSLQEVAKNTVQASRIANDVANHASQSNEIINHLEEVAKKIGSIVEVIDDIADQTNLLALNATIEAASAGEAGKGFAVVANEVKELSKQTAASTEKISQQVADMQDQTSKAVESIHKIATVVGEMNTINQVIASSVEEQTSTMNEISRSVVNAATGAREVSKNVQDLSLSLREIVVVSIQEASKAVGEVSENIQGVNIAAQEAANGSQIVRQEVEQMTGLIGRLNSINTSTR